MKNKFDRILLLIFITIFIITIINIKYQKNKRNKESFIRTVSLAKDIAKDIKKFNVNEYKKINELQDNFEDVLSFNFFMKPNDCSLSINNMNLSLDEIIKKYPKSQINFMIAYNDNFKEIKNYVNSYYKSYTKRIQFYFLKNKVFSKLNFTYTPCLIVKSKENLKYGILFTNKKFFNIMIKKGFEK